MGYFLWQVKEENVPSDDSHLLKTVEVKPSKSQHVSWTHVSLKYVLDSTVCPDFPQYKLEA